MNGNPAEYAVLGPREKAIAKIDGGLRCHLFEDRRPKDPAEWQLWGVHIGAVNV
jgi:hypothetical protein